MTALNTPYGTTTFLTYTPSGATVNLPQGLKITYPDGSAAVFENWIGETKTTYHWDREAMELYPNDPINHVYNHCETTKYCYDVSTGLESPIPNFTRKPLEAVTSFGYGGLPPGDVSGASNRPTSIIQPVTANADVSVIVGGARQQGDVLSIKVTDGLLTGGPETVSYTVQNGDTLSSIASGVASAINADQNLPPIGVTATASGTVVHIQSLSTNGTLYATSVSQGSTETLSAFANGTNATVGQNMTGTAALLIQDSSLPGGQQTVSYPIQTGDTPTTVSAALAAAVNSNSNLASAGISATAAAGITTVQSLSANNTSFGDASSGGASLSLAVAPTLASSNFQYNTFGHMTQSIDQLGRTFNYLYSANNVDLLEVRESTAGDNFLIGKWQYNSQHRPTVWIDGSGQKTQYAYTSNGYGELHTVSDPLNNVTTFNYSGLETATVSGSGSAATQTIKITDAALPSPGYVNVQYTPVTGDTASSVASKFAALINANTSLQALRVSASAYGSVLTMSSSSTGTTYSATAASPYTITLAASSASYLAQTVAPVSSAAVTTSTWDASGQLGSVADSEGYTRYFAYDALNRLLQTSYPDGTTKKTVWQALDPIFSIDRLGRTTTRTYDSLDELVQETDPLGRSTQYAWCACGSLMSLTDASGHTTTWHHDLEGRTTSKIYNDNTTISYSYEPARGLLISRLDANNQTTNYVYNLDGTLEQTSYLNALNHTPFVTLSYDGHFPRLTEIQTDFGASAFTYSYAYNAYITDPFGSATTGGGRLYSVTDSRFSPNLVTTYSYDALGRTTNRSINGSSNSITWSYDAISRVTSEQNALGYFAYTYVDQTPTDKGTYRLSNVNYQTNSSPSTAFQSANFNWYGTGLDERLKQINNLTAGSNPLGISQFNYGFDSAGEITTWGQQQSQVKLGYQLNYDAAGQLISAQSGPGMPAPPFTRQHYYNYDAAANRTAAQRDALQNATVGGYLTNTDTVTLTVNDAGLTNGTQPVSYQVNTSLDTNTAAVASKLAAAVTASPQMQAIGVSATASGSTIALRSVSPNITTYSYTQGTNSESIAFGLNEAAENITVNGTGDGRTITVTVHDASLSGGYQNINYLTATGQTAAQIATGLASALGALPSSFTTTQVGGSTSPVISVQSNTPYVTSYTWSISGTGTPSESLSLGTVLNGSQSFIVGGTGGASGSDQLQLTVQDAGLSSPVTVSATVASGDLASTMAGKLVSQINANASLMNIGVTSSNNGAIVTVSSTSVNPTSYVPGVSSASTVPSETLTAGAPANGTVPIEIGGTLSSGNSWSITVYDAAYGSSTVSHTYGAGDTLDIIANDLSTALNSLSGISSSVVSPTTSASVINVTSTSSNATTYTSSVVGSASVIVPATVGVTQYGFGTNGLNELQNISAGGATRFQGTTDRPVLPVTMNSGAVNATMLSSKSFLANPVLSTGVNAETVTAAPGGGSSYSTTNTYQVNVIGPASSSLTYDSNGNMTSDGTNSYAWDAENRLVQITYPGTGNISQFSYDGFGRCVKIVEVTSGTATSTKQFVWCGNRRCEVRDGSDNITAQFFPYGETIGGTSYFFTKDHLGSIREMTGSSGGIVWQQSFDPYGTPTAIVSTTPADFGYAGYYVHSRSGLNLTRTRAYSAGLGRFISRDPISERGGSNLYAYVGNMPINITDPRGWMPPVTGIPNTSQDDSGDLGPPPAAAPGALSGYASMGGGSETNSGPTFPGMNIPMNPIDPMNLPNGGFTPEPPSYGPPGANQSPPGGIPDAGPVPNGPGNGNPPDGSVPDLRAPQGAYPGVPVPPGGYTEPNPGIPPGTCPKK